MKSISAAGALFIAILILLSIFYIWGIGSVPFHPDESTYIFMSADVDAIFHNPLQMSWTPGAEINPVVHYRLLDAPLVRYMIGTARDLTGAGAATRVDWDWTRNWDSNLSAGAYPSSDVLWISRLVMTCLIPLGLIAMYHSGVSLGSPFIGIAAALFFGLNSLVLLHARRAMGESVMMFGILFFLSVLLAFPGRAWLLAIAAALAFNAKYSTLALFPVGLLALFLFRLKQNKPWVWLVKSGLIYVSIFLVITFILNPFLWRYPLSAVQTAAQERLKFVQGQVDFLEANAPNLVLRTPGDRAAAMLSELYLTPPSFYDAGNYAKNTAPVEAVYRQIPGHFLTANLGWSVLSLILMVFGLVFAVRNLIQSHGEQRNRLILLSAALICEMMALLITVPIPYQRYYLPMLPFFCLLTAYGVYVIFQPIIQKIKPSISTQPEETRI